MFGAAVDPPHAQHLAGPRRVPCQSLDGVGLDAWGPREERPLIRIGAEAIVDEDGISGLSRLVRQRCDAIVSIPMLGRISSLNVSTAAAVALYEVSRARRNAT